MVRNGVTVEFDRPRTLKYTINAQVRFKELTGKNIIDFKMQNLDWEEMRYMVYAGLIHETPEITLEEVGNLMDECPDGLGGIAEKVMEAFGNAMAGNSGNVSRLVAKFGKK